MRIGELMDALQRKAELSDRGYEAEVKLNLHMLEFNGAGYYIETSIEDVSNVWGPGEDYCQIETVLKKKDLTVIQELLND